MAASTEEYGEVFADFATHAIAWLNELRSSAKPVEHVIDIGSGPGVASCAFAEAFPHALVTAADSSPAMLERATARAERLGVGERVRVVRAELPDDVGGLGTADVVWVSTALHHVGDEVAALRTMGGMLRPGGMIIIAEFPPGESHMTVLPPSIDDELPGFRERVADVRKEWFASMRAGLAGSTPSRAVEDMVRAAGLEVVGSRVERIRIEAPLSDMARRVVAKDLDMLITQMGTYLDEADKVVLQQLHDPNNGRNLVERPDAVIDAARLIVVARAAF